MRIKVRLVGVQNNLKRKGYALVFQLKFHEGQRKNKPLSAKRGQESGACWLKPLDELRLIGGKKKVDMRDLVMLYSGLSSCLFSLLWELEKETAVFFSYYSHLKQPIEKKVKKYPICPPVWVFIYLYLPSLWIALPCGSGVIHLFLNRKYRDGLNI